MLKLSAQPPHSVLVPCINIDPGPRNITTDAYKTETGVIPTNKLFDLTLSFEMTQNIKRPLIINPRLLQVFNGSLNNPPETVSHQREAWPIR
jgi:hypothetical protein